MKVLVTGAAGQVGRALLKGAPTGVVVVGLTHGQLDITDAAAVATVVGQNRPDVIVNAAAYTAVDKAESDSETARRINSDGPRNLASAARESKARIVHISTDFVFDGSSPVPYGPDAATNPLNVYGLTKREGERQVLQLLPEGSVVLRTAWVYAPEGNNFVRTMLRLMGEGKAVRVVADQVGTPTAAGSVASVIWKVTARPDIIGIHHWTDAGVASWYDFAVAIAEEALDVGLLSSRATVTPISTDEYPSRAQRPRYSVLDTCSLMSALEESPIQWRDSLRAVLREMTSA